MPQVEAKLPNSRVPYAGCHRLRLHNSSVQYTGCHRLRLHYITLEYEQRGGGGRALPDFFSSLSFPCSADHERDWPPFEVVFFGLATNALNVRNNNFSPLTTTGECSEGLGAF